MRSDDGYSLAGVAQPGDAEVRRGLSVSVDPLGSLGRSVQTAAWATALAVVDRCRRRRWRSPPPDASVGPSTPA